MSAAGVEEAGRRLARQEREGRGNYILVVREWAGPRLVQRTVVDPTGDGDTGDMSDMRLMSVYSDREHRAVSEPLV